MEGRRSETALGTARARFVEGLPRKANELRGAVALLASTPEAPRPREELRRRLHALYASAQVFHLDTLAEALRDAIKQLDAARDEGRPLEQDEVDAIASLAATLPALVQEGAAPTPSTGPAPLRRSERPPGGGRAAKTTLRGIASSPPPSDAVPPQIIGLPSAHDARADRPSRPPARRAVGSFTAGRLPSERPPSSLTPLDTIVSVLVIDDIESQASIRAALPAERFELVGANDPEQGLRLARMGAPDVVLANRDLIVREDVEFVGRLRSDPLTDFVPVILLLPPGSANDLIAVREEGADATLGKPIDAEELVRTVVRVTGNVPGGDEAFVGHLGDLTPEELANRLAQELRRGLVEAAETGRDVRVPMGDGAEVLAAAWSAIARVRASIAQRSGGRVRFRDSARRGGPAVMALVDDDARHAAEAGDAVDVALAHRRVIVADDDPAVVWFFSGLLREEGAEVFEAGDGREALEEARSHRPDLIISDILMPEIDGFELCRELARDPALADVPVILLSWKEDFLQRMRDLQSGASGYLRKEAGTAQILERVREVLRPLARLEAQLQAGGELRGRIEGVGMPTLLRTVAQHRPNARITARDAWNLFEVDIRGGDLVAVTRTATDGSFVRGPKALPQLLGVTTGRFTVTASDAHVRGTFSGALEQVISDGTSQLGAVLDAVTGRGMHHADRVRFDEDVLASFLRTSPEPIKKIVERMRDGAGPRELLVADDVAPHALDSALVDLARRGAIAEVRGPDGEDRIADALHARRSEAHGETEEGQEEGQEEGREADEQDVEELERSGELEVQAVAAAAVPAAEPVAAIGDTPKPDTSIASVERDGPTPVRRPRKRRDSVDELDMPFSGNDEEAEPPISSRPPPPLRDEAVQAGVPPSAPLGVPTPSDDSDTTEFEPVRVASRGDNKEESVPIELARRSPRPPPPPPDRPRASEPARIPSTPPVRTTDTEAEPAHVGERDTWRPGPRSEPSTLAWVFLLVVLGVLGFVGYELVGGSVREDDETETPANAEETEGEADPEGAGEEIDPERTGTEDLGEIPPQELSYGETIPRIEPGPVSVAEGEGLLVVELPASGVPTEVQIGERELGNTPVRLALPEGRHELVFRRGDETSYRYLYLRAGQTRVVQAP